MKNLLILVLMSVFVLSCNDSKNNNLSAFDKQMQANKHPGKKLMETNCYVCHSPKASHDDRIGPPMIAIKKHYINEETTKDEFIEAMQAWIKNPNKEDAKMHGAVRRFGVMPKQAFPEETIEQIADYLFEYDIDQPEWFEDHFNEEMGKEKGKGKVKGKGKGMQHGKKQASIVDKDLSYEELGLKYALGTKTELGKNLMGKIQKEGTKAAITFCNDKAYTLTDSMAKIYNATIKRVSDKPRNTHNNANSKELGYIKKYKAIVSKREESKPISEVIDDKVHVYYPIVTNTMCLQCHGKPKTDIDEINYKKIKDLYPEDMAVGYNENEVRGMWHITFTK